MSADEFLAERESAPVDVHTWQVIPAQPGTRIEWKADWCGEGSVLVHAWLFHLDVLAESRYGLIDTSCCVGEPMVLNAVGQLQIAKMADLDGHPGEVLEP